MKFKWLGLFLLLGAVLTACSTSGPEEPSEVTSLPEDNFTPTVEQGVIPTIDTSDTPPSRATSEFITDFSKHSVPYNEILSGGPPKDGIASIDDPIFISVQEADEWLAAVEPVIFVQVGEDARAYPVQILIWHEIVNDTVGDLPLTVTFCPLCNTAIAFERTLDGQVLDFGTTGRLRFSNLVMYDRQTESWWQQGTGEAIVGELLGKQLAFYPAAMIAWGDFMTSFPGGKVLSRETGFSRAYGRNPYVGYDNINNSPFLFRGDTPGELSAMERVLAVEINGETVAYPFSVLSEIHVVKDRVGGEDVVVFWFEGTASGLDAGSVASGRDVGAAGAFSPNLNGELLSFAFVDGEIVDDATQSSWDIFGKAISGPLSGEKLKPLTAVNHFWFDWVAFKPDTKVYTP